MKIRIIGSIKILISSFGLLSLITAVVNAGNYLEEYQIMRRRKYRTWFWN